MAKKYWYWTGNWKSAGMFVQVKRCDEIIAAFYLYGIIVGVGM
jgi:hypothetical protein